jgi:hypothetical protein
VQGQGIYRTLWTAFDAKKGERGGCLTLQEREATGSALRGGGRVAVGEVEIELVQRRVAAVGGEVDGGLEAVAGDERVGIRGGEPRREHRPHQRPHGHAQRVIAIGQGRVETPRHAVGAKRRRHRSVHALLRATAGHAAPDRGPLDIREHATLFIEPNVAQAGAGGITLVVSGLDALLERLAAQDTRHEPIETYANGVRHVKIADPDGNAIAFAERPDSPVASARPA